MSELKFGPLELVKQLGELRVKGGGGVELRLKFVEAGGCGAGGAEESGDESEPTAPRSP